MCWINIKTRSRKRSFSILDLARKCDTRIGSSGGDSGKYAGGGPCGRAYNAGIEVTSSRSGARIRSNTDDIYRRVRDIVAIRFVVDLLAGTALE